jgi:FKBP-type peptidyl-prolyl cis-trans isomerase (trigger factor)
MAQTAALTREQDGTIKLVITLPWPQVEKTREEVIEATTKSANLAGFRKGKAPKKLVEENVDPAKVQEEVLKKLLPAAYVEAVKEHDLRPVMNPKIHVEKLEEGQDWSFTAITCEAPEIKLNDYKKKVQDITAKSKIVVPGKEPQEPNFDEVMKAVIENTEATIPAILIEQEADRLLSQTLDEIKRLGLTLDQYLSSTGKNPETLRAEYAQKAQNDMKLEFVLQKIAETEKIAVEDKEIEEAIAKAKDPQERQNLEANRYLLASILRQQKTLDFLKNL